MPKSDHKTKKTKKRQSHYEDRHSTRKKDKSEITESKEAIIEQLKKLAKQHNKIDKKAENTPTPSTNDRTPMTKESYEKKRSIITTKYDPETGRTRRVRATGEVLETIVTREQHYQINKTATMGDGLFYQSHIQSMAYKK